MDKHYLEFEDSEENKLSYTTIFNDYVSHGVSWSETGRLVTVPLVIVASGLGSSGGSYSLLCRSACWRNTWSSSWPWGSPASTWTTSQSCYCETRCLYYWQAEATGLMFDAPVVLQLQLLATRWHNWTLMSSARELNFSLQFTGRTKMRCQVTSLTCCWHSLTSLHSRRCSWTTDVWVFCEPKHYFKWI